MTIRRYEECYTEVSNNGDQNIKQWLLEGTINNYVEIKAWQLERKKIKK